ncbi:MAG: hypothetical protein OEV94_10635 [Deltaproteobacteria bacterium]|nr:hypothetical protein [Deltaproteobacteria bacterium]
MKRDIPDAYLPFWEPYAGPGRLEHTTTLSNWLHIQACGYLEPRDPFPHTWSGMRAVFLSDRDDPHYNTRIPRVLNHVSKKGSPLVRLYLDSPRGRSLHLFKSNAEGRTAQVISLEPIAVERIYSMEVVFPEGA